MTGPDGQGPPGPAETGSAPAASLVGPAGSVGLERSIARLLTIGTYVSIGLLLVGVVLMFAGGIGPLSGGPTFNPGHLVADLTSLRPAGFVWLGLVAVVCTPAARVVASLIGYARRGERAMTIVAALILVVIATSVVLAQALQG